MQYTDMTTVFNDIYISLILVNYNHTYLMVHVITTIHRMYFGPFQTVQGRAT